MTERKEIIEMLKVLKEQALKSHNDTAIIDVKKDSFIYVMNVAINSLEIDERYELEYEQIEQKTDVLDKIRAKIAEYGSIWVVYEITDKTKTDKGIEKLVSDVLSQAKEQVLDIIDKYKAESEE